MQTIKEIILSERESKAKRAKNLNWDTGYEKLDHVIGGFFARELIIIGGRLGNGSDEFILNTALRQAQLGKQVILYSFQKNEHTLLRCFLAILTNISLEKLGGDNLTADEEILINKSIIELGNYDISIHTETIDIENIERQLNKRNIKENAIIFIDRFQLLAEYTESTSLHLHGPNIILRMKEMAISMNIPIIMHSSVSKNVEERGGDRKPFAYDLLGTESIEVTPNKILLFYRPEYYGFCVDENGLSEKNKIYLLVVKNDFGAANELIFQFNDQTKKICDKAHFDISFD